MLSTNGRHRVARPANVRRFVAAVGIAGVGAVIPVASAGVAQAQPSSPAEQTAAGVLGVVSATPTAAVETAPAKSTPADKADYVVQAGDTLFRLAASNNVSGGWKSLYELNRDVLLSGPDLIQVGQTLRFAGTAPAAAPTASPEAAKPEAAKPATIKPKLTVKAPTTTESKPSTSKPAVTPLAKTSTGGSKGAQAPTGGSTTSAPSSSKAAQAVAFARAQVGKPYVYGAAGPNAFDCSGLVQAAYKSAGISLPRVTNAQFAADAHVSIANLQPGDLVFFYSGISHVGIYIGDGKMVHAANSRKPVEIASINTMPIAGATRPA